MNIDQIAAKTEVTHTRETRRCVEIKSDDIEFVICQAFAEKWGVGPDQVSIAWRIGYEEFNGLSVSSAIKETEKGEL